MRNAITNNALALSAASTVSSVTPVQVNDGIEDLLELNGVQIPQTLEVRMTLSKSKNEKVLFSFHGGNVARSGKGDLFTSFWLMPPVYRERQIQFTAAGDLQRSKVWASLVSKEQVDPALSQQLSLIQSLPEEQRVGFLQLITLQSPAMAEKIKSALQNSGGVKYQSIDHLTLLNQVFGHFNVKFKANLNRLASQIESIQDRLVEAEEGQKFSLVLRFNLIQGVNAVKELVELQHYSGGLKENGTEATCYPNGSPIVIQEVTLNPTYVGIIEGSTYEVDSSKFVDPEVMAAGLMKATQVKSDNKPTYLDRSILSARATRVNAWSEKIEQATGNKWLKKLGYTGSKGETPKFFELALQSHYGNVEAKAEFEAMKVALEGAVGQKDLTSDRVESIVKAAFDFVESQVEASMKQVQSSVQSENEASIEESASSIEESEDKGSPLDGEALASILSGDWSNVFG